MLEFRLLGPLEVRDGERLIPVPRQKQRALLGALLLRAGQVVAKDRLIDDLWGEQPPPRAENALHNYLSQLRRALGADVVVTRPPGYLIQVTPDQVDSLRFERLVAGARGAEPRERVETLREALSLFRGPPLADLRFELFVQTEIQRLEELELGARADLHDAQLELGRHAEIVPALEALVASYPYREHLRANLMLALYRCGRQADALAVYQQGRTVLVEELGIEPGDELQQLERAILQQDPALRPPRSARVDEEPEPPAAEAVPVRPVRRPSRKTVTILVATVAADGARGSPDPESQRADTDRFVAVATGVVEAHGGSVERRGRDLTAVFGVPAAHEDDALRGLRAAVELRSTLAEADTVVRAGVTTGEVFVTEEADQAVTGDVVGAAARLAEVAGPGEILLAAETRRLVQGSVTVDEAPGAAGVPVFRLVELDSGAGSRLLRLDSPLVGRERPLAALENARAGAVADQRCHLFTVLGEAGVGKSRLVAEFTGGLGDSATVTRGRCLAYGSTALAPLLEAVRNAGAADRANELEAQPEAETRAVARRHFESLARDRPLVIVLDDVQWAAPSLLDFVEETVERSRNAAILFVCVARPELHEARPSWGGGKPNASSVLLEPLTPGESERLMNNLLGQSDLPEPVRDHIIGASEGNPLFLEELLAMLVDRAVLRREGDRWTTEELPVLAIPPTVQALIAARVDRLPDEERVLLEAASIEGKLFRRATVAGLVSEQLASTLDLQLAALVRRELIRPTSAAEDVFTFRHQLVRDATYDAMPKRVRADLHERFADSVDRPAEVQAFHRDAAERYRRELGFETA